MRYPILYQVNLRLTLNALSENLGRQATLDDLPDQQLQGLSQLGFDWLYLICLWETGQAEAEMARGYASLREEARQKLGTDDQALCSSCFAISGYNVPQEWGGKPALLRLKERLNQLGMRLMLDFIPNHVGISHPWAIQHPEYFIQASFEKWRARPGEYYQVGGLGGERFLAHGRDPYFPPWSDTLQLNYASPALQAAMQEQLLQLSERCDGLRCDMAMLELPEVFQRIWELQMKPFWPAALAKVKKQRPDFVFMAEVYWGLERELVSQGFDYTYDKTLYDRLVEGDASRVSEQIRAELDLIDHQVHFLENHDEKRAALVFPPGKHAAAAVISYFLPGLRFFFNGQLQGHTVHSPMQFCRAPVEATDPLLEAFYTRLMDVLRETTCQPGSILLLDARQSGQTATCRDVIAFSWLDDAGKRWLGGVNYSEHPSQCLVELTRLKIGAQGLSPEKKFVSSDHEQAHFDLTENGLTMFFSPRGYQIFQICVASQ